MFNNGMCWVAWNNCNYSLLGVNEVNQLWTGVMNYSYFISDSRNVPWVARAYKRSSGVVYRKHEFVSDWLPPQRSSSWKLGFKLFRCLVQSLMLVTFTRCIITNMMVGVLGFILDWDSGGENGRSLDAYVSSSFFSHPQERERREASEIQSK